MIMSDWLALSQTPWDSAWLYSLIVASATKSSLLFATAFAIAFLLRKRSASSRHLAWSLAIAGSLLLPFLLAVVPSWPLAFKVNLAETRWARLSGKAAAEPRLPASELPSSFTAQAGGPAWIAQAPAGPTRIDAATLVIDVPSPPVPKKTEVPLFVSRVVSALRSTAAVSVWAIGMLVSGVPVVAGILSLRRLARRSRPVTDMATLRLAEKLAARMGLKREVRLVMSPGREIPMTWGVFRPVVLLPGDAKNWTEERLSMALLHELAHVKRWDCLTQVVARATCALYWFNPLSWLALARLRDEQEQACDDLALGCGFDSHAYAGHLLAIVTGRAVAAPRAFQAVAMARSAKLEHRLRGILDSSRSRRAPGRRAVGFAAAAACALILPLAAVSPGATARADQPAGQAAANRGDEPKSDAEAVGAEVLAKVREAYVKTPDEQALKKGAIKGIIDALHDAYSTYIDEQQLAALERDMQSKLTGIGAQLTIKEGEVTVVSPLLDSPAFKAGIRAGDIIDEVDGKPTKGLELAEIVKRIVGKAGEVVRLSIRHADGRAEELAVTRGVVTVRSVSGFRLRGGDWDYLLDPDHVIGYVQLRHFTSDTPSELKKALERLKALGAKGLILDLRNCPGGLMGEAVKCAQMFVAKGTIVTLKGRDEPGKAFSAEASAQVVDVPMVALVDGSTASAGEIVAGALKDNERAIVLGSRTFGKGSVQTIVKLKDGAGAIRLTTAYYHLPSGQNIDKQEGKTEWGVDPTDGYFVPVGAKALGELNARRMKRGVVGGPEAEGGVEKVTPESIERDQADPQLGAALKTLIARTTQGTFLKVGLPIAEQTARLKRVDDARKRKQSLIDDLKKVEKELSELGQDAKQEK
jgi:carboxyl-terminal processing protease